jgi:hypothetical protein
MVFIDSFCKSLFVLPVALMMKASKKKKLLHQSQSESIKSF